MSTFIAIGNSDDTRNAFRAELRPLLEAREQALLARAALAKAEALGAVGAQG